MYCLEVIIVICVCFKQKRTTVEPCTSVLYICFPLHIFPCFSLCLATFSPLARFIEECKKCIHGQHLWDTGGFCNNVVLWEIFYSGPGTERLYVAQLVLAYFLCIYSVISQSRNCVRVLFGTMTLSLLTHWRWKSLRSVWRNKLAATRSACCETTFQTFLASVFGNVVFNLCEVHLKTWTSMFFHAWTWMFGQRQTYNKTPLFACTELNTQDTISSVSDHIWWIFTTEAMLIVRLSHTAQCVNI